MANSWMFMMKYDTRGNYLFDIEKETLLSNALLFI